MDPDHLVGMGFLGAVLAASGLLHEDNLTPEQRQQKRAEAEERRISEIAAKRAASPEVAAAERKRARKAEKLRTSSGSGRKT